MLNIIISLCLLCVSFGGVYLSMQLPLFSDPDILFSTKPSFYPIIIFCGLAICSILYMIKSIKNYKYDNRPLLSGKTLIIMSLFIGYMISLVYLKFIASTLLFNAAAGYYLLDDKTKPSIIRLSITSVSIVIVLYVLFVKFFNVPL